MNNEQTFDFPKSIRKVLHFDKFASHRVIHVYLRFPSFPSVKMIETFVRLNQRDLSEEVTIYIINGGYYGAIPLYIKFSHTKLFMNNEQT